MKQSKLSGGTSVPPSTSDVRIFVDDIRQFLGTTLEIKPITKKREPRRKIVAIGDLHGNPHPALLPLIIAENPDYIIFGGDTYDQADFSNHPKAWREKTEDFNEEIVRVVAYLEILLTKTNAIIIFMRGNHDDRFYKQLMALVPERFLPFIKDPLEMLIAGLPADRCKIHSDIAVFHAPNVPPAEMGKLQYMLVLGDALFSHANFTGGADSSGVGKLSRWVDDWYQALGWPQMSLLVQFHTHQWIYLRPRAGFRVLVEPGMGGMPAVEGYKIGYQSKWRPGTLGAMVVEQEEVKGEWLTIRKSVNWLIP